MVMMMIIRLIQRSFVQIYQNQKLYDVANKTKSFIYQNQKLYLPKSKALSTKIKN